MYRVVIPDFTGPSKCYEGQWFDTLENAYNSLLKSHWCSSKRRKYIEDDTKSIVLETATFNGLLARDIVRSGWTPEELNYLNRIE